MNIVKKMFCFYYLLNKGKWNNRKDSIILAFGGVGVVFIWHACTILFILKICGIHFKFINKTSIFGSMIFIYAVLAIYFFLFKNYKIADEVQQYSPWKKPVVWGGIYLLLSLLVLLFVLWMVPIG